MKRAIVFVLLMLFAQAVAWAETGQVELTQEKQDILKAIQLLEEDPLRIEAKDLRAKVMRFAADSPDVLVVLDEKFLKFIKLEYKYANEMAFHYIAGCVKFDILNPSLARDKTADIVAGVESAIVAYSSILALKPLETNAFMEELTAMKNSGQLTLANVLPKFQ